MAASSANGGARRSNPNPQYGAAVQNLTSNVNAPQQGGLLTLDPSAPPSSVPMQPPQAAGLLGMPQPTFDGAPGLLTPDLTPYSAGGGDPGQGAGVGKTLAQMAAERTAAGIPTPVATGPMQNLGQQLASLGLPGVTSFGGPPAAPNPSPMTNGYADLPAGPLPAPQTVDPQVYTDKAIAVNGPLMTPPKGPPQAVPPQMPPQAAPPQATQPPDSAAPLAASINTNQQALADALTRLRAAQQQAGGYPSSLFRRAGNPMGAYQ